MRTKLITTGLTMAAAVLMCTAEVSAGWGSSGGSWGGSSGGSWGGSSGSHGGYSVSYGSSGGSSGGSWGSHGSRGGGLFARWHARRAARHWCHSSGGSYGYSAHYGSSGGSWGGSSGGSAGSYVVPQEYSVPMNGAPTDAAPMENGSGESAPATPPNLPPENGASLDRDEGGLTVSVPADAKIFVNGKATSSTGSYREYISRGLEPGYEYNYEVRAEVVRNGETISDVKTVSLTAGKLERVAFDFATEEVETVVKLNVPADAKVTLAGNATESKGETREFKTTGLAKGQTWNGYDIVVSIERDGRTLTKEQTVDLEGGQDVSLSFDFDETSVAAR